MVKPDILISDSQRSKEMLIDLGMDRKDVALICAVIDWNPELIKKQLFDIKVSEIDKNRLVQQLLKESFFTEEAVSSLIDDLCSALQSTSDSEWPIHIDGCLYFGDLKNGKLNGKGMLVDILGDISAGVFHDGALDEGLKVWRNGDVFSGEFCVNSSSQSDLFCGFNAGMVLTGDVHLRDGSRFNGDFFNGVPNYGTLIWPNGDDFVGDLYLSDYYDGELELYSGTIVFNDGREFEGSFEDNLPEKGDLFWPDGDHFNGEFYNGSPWKGKLEFFNGTTYEGELDEDCNFCGEGVLETANELYEGKFEDSELVYGHIIMMDGSEYEGECYNYLPDGMGTWVFPNGSYIEGVFSNGLLVDDPSYHDLTKFVYLRIVEQDNFDYLDKPFVSNPGDSGNFYDYLPQGILQRGIMSYDNLCDSLLIKQNLYDLHEVYEQSWRIPSDLDDGFRLEYNDGLYLGEIQDGLPNGFGSIQYPDGTVESGFYIQGKLEGLGEISFNNGNFYEGEFVDGVIEGQGHYYCEDFGEYTGEFANNCPDGEGCWDLDSGCQLIGHFSKGELVSLIRMQMPEGETYIGELEDLVPEGFGLFIYDDGVYYGEVKKGSPNGHGYFLTDKLFASGNFEYGTLVGVGRFEYFDGREYYGEFNTLPYDEYCGFVEINEPEGYGIMYYPDGQVDEGVFEDGIIREGFRFIDKIEIYSGSFDQLGNIQGIKAHIRCRLNQLGSVDHYSVEDSVIPSDYLGVYRCALSGNSSSALFIAECFLEGRNGFARSNESAYRWYIKADELCDSDVEDDISEPVLLNDSNKIVEDRHFEEDELDDLSDDEPSRSCQDSQDQAQKKLMDDMEFLDVRGVIYLFLEFHNLPSVQDLVEKYPFESLNLQKAMRVVCNLNLDNPLQSVLSDLRKGLSLYMQNDVLDSFCDMFKNVAEDYIAHVPRGFGRLIDDSFMTQIAFRTVECDECGEPIESGDKVFIRTEPARCVRHPQCNSTVRWKYEYAHYKYYIEEIKYFEDLFSNQENTDYVLDLSLTHNVFKKAGFVTDKDRVISRLPRFSDFVLKYISGTSDYDLMMEFRPYHVYIQFLLNLKGVANDEIADMGGFKFLLREKIGARIYPELSASLENTSYSELFFDEPIYMKVDSEVKRIIYSAVIHRMFSDEGLLVGDSNVLVDGEEKSFSVNLDDGSDILITADRMGVFCTDDTTSVPINEYFDLKPESEQYLNYISSFEVS